ncbi:hypothetical protein CkaCkLH20_12275 [Colletotrichum karsti]|uniref:FAD dependent oxidoreductase n=1 Tax=Colletotrichum karsti TaxID=1095194 RepID=A0A9P6HTZ9_9PEZI|nr:uncharacterized protein CkaCkLH20_12275 [Colletotrichum karsti]KAF9870189.1 hypothetical protein CkaCkLH20_12275 [Colletotrichum karsti]
MAASGILIEAEAFDDYGGWLLDSQFETEMGSPYLIAHGNGKQVKDAKTTIQISESGLYNVWVRAKDWVPGFHPGRFGLSLNGTSLQTEFGANDMDWNWEFGGSIQLGAGSTTLVLHDVAGFCGRCDAIFLSTGDTPPLNGVDEPTRAWRRALRGLPETPESVGRFDVAVVGGGIPGCVAALTAARLGERVALIQDRPFLGGNASIEIGLSPRGTTGPVVQEVSRRGPTGDLEAAQLLNANPNATVFLEHTVCGADTVDGTITSIKARHSRTGREIIVSASTFIDCSGKAILGLYSGAETLYGQEPRAAYGESLAPERGNNMHHGNTVFFRTRMAENPVPFPPVPWATPVAGDFADLGGQLISPGYENGPGPRVDRGEHADENILRRMKMPLTHFWEYGQWLDPYTQGEQIRDHLLRAIYGTFSNVKTMRPEEYANLELEWVAMVAAQGEFRRYKGDYVLSESDIRTHKGFPDAVVQNSGAFCLHWPGHKRYDFRLSHWDWDERDEKPYDIPFRCFYSVNINNLMMAGKHLSATRVSMSNAKFMGNGGQHAVATAVAAHLCHKYGTSPRGIHSSHLAELKDLVAGVLETGRPRVASRL